VAVHIATESSRGVWIVGEFIHSVFGIPNFLIVGGCVPAYQIPHAYIIGGALSKRIFPTFAIDTAQIRDSNVVGVPHPRRTLIQKSQLLHVILAQTHPLPHAHIRPQRIDRTDGRIPLRRIHEAIVGIMHDALEIIRTPNGIDIQGFLKRALRAASYGIPMNGNVGIAIGAAVLVPKAQSVQYLVDDAPEVFLLAAPSHVNGSFGVGLLADVGSADVVVGGGILVSEEDVLGLEVFSRDEFQHSGVLFDVVEGHLNGRVGFGREDVGGNGGFDGVGDLEEARGGVADGAAVGGGGPQAGELVGGA